MCLTRLQMNESIAFSLLYQFSEVITIGKYQLYATVLTVLRLLTNRIRVLCYNTSLAEARSTAFVFFEGENLIVRVRKSLAVSVQLSVEASTCHTAPLRCGRTQAEFRTWRPAEGTTSRLAPQFSVIAKVLFPRSGGRQD